MGFDVGSVDHQPLEIRFVDDEGEEFIPYPLVPPSTEAAMGVFPIAVLWRQVTPWRTSAQYPYDGVDELPIILCGAAPIMGFSGQTGLNYFPCAVVNVVPMKSGIHSVLRLVLNLYRISYEPRNSMEALIDYCDDRP